MDAMAVSVEDGVQHSHAGQDEQARVSNGGPVAFVWRLFARIASYITRIRRFFVFSVAVGGNLVLREEGKISKNDNKVEEYILVETPGACEPEIVEIVVFQQEAINPGPHNVDSRAVELHHEDCGSKRNAPTKEDHQLRVSVAHHPNLDVEEYEVRANEPTSAIRQATTDLRPGVLTWENCDSKFVELYLEDCGNKCTVHIKVAQEFETWDAINSTLLRADNHEHHTIERTSAIVLPTNDHYRQEQIVATCGTVDVSPLELNLHDHSKADTDQADFTQEKIASQEKKFLDVDIISDKCVFLQSPSPLSVTNDIAKSLKVSSLESPKKSTSSPKLNKYNSIQQLNAIVGEQLIKYLQFLERSVVPGKLEHATWKTTQRRAIILVTLVAIAVWARNAKHLHESMPRIRGFAINVHIRSRL
ncbi:uncharacterized protein [Physcomitrium patens]|uniref:Uncharacterized protein n=1 Tax=Physcomitrium patens TaxID=3218 RepID=A0A2K1IN05_PHYPA|nr:uncharacterized protein LOC112274980 isoform X1 [Physcomitrium patens]XP_024360649.1 uncharacterized protein LOC112274980 isoform X1 [Physcomitrium patens]PNR30654.1 hypothetical protein PHYPA_026970 [Physcomitrium patens]|eukprot:XP_024360647.1 uncharacterized protein LOC112274980 isoform X1 [Physcomitrella patens]